MSSRRSVYGRMERFRAGQGTYHVGACRPFTSKTDAKIGRTHEFILSDEPKNVGGVAHHYWGTNGASYSDTLTAKLRPVISAKHSGLL